MVVADSLSELVMTNEPWLTVTYQSPAREEVFCITMSEFGWTFSSVTVWVFPVVVHVWEVRVLPRRYGL